MSWKDKIENSKFKIITGDGKEFFPLLKLGSKSKDYNATTFEFIDLDGSFVARKKAKSSKLDLVFYFQGEQHVEECNEFEKSADDSRYWLIEHPYYGTLKGQPLSLSRNDSSLNNTEISVDFWESIVFGYLEPLYSLKDEIKAKKIELTAALNLTYLAKTELKPVDQNKLKKFVDKINLSYDKLLDDTNYNEYQKNLSSVYSAIDKVLVSPSGLISDISTLIDAPSNFVKSIQFRITLMEALFNSMKLAVNFSNKNDKSFFEAFGASVISSICETALSPNKEDFISRKEIESISFQLNNIYSDYLLTLDNAQTPIENLSNAFSLDYTSQVLLNSIINRTLFNLFSFAFNAKQEREIELEKNSNLIILTHKYLGLDADDKNIEKFRKMNNITNKKIFGIKKGTVIKYLV